MKIVLLDDLLHHVKSTQYLNFYNKISRINIPEITFVYREESENSIYIMEYEANPSKKGYGQKAMKQILLTAKEEKLELYLSSKLEAIPFWEKMGFKLEYQSGLYVLDFRNKI